MEYKCTYPDQADIIAYKPYVVRMQSADSQKDHPNHML